MSIGIETVVADHVLTDSLCLACGLSSDLTMDVETCVAPAEDLLHQGKADELFPQQHGEDLAGEDLLDNFIMSTPSQAFFIAEQKSNVNTETSPLITFMAIFGTKKGETI